jgi:hypothetical protein
LATTPQAQDSTARPVRDRTPAEYYGVPGLFPPALAADLAAFEEALPPEQGARFRALVAEVDNAVNAATLRAEDEQWRRVLAHFPGLAPALGVVWSHVHALSGGCGAGSGCELAPLALESRTS